MEGNRRPSFKKRPNSPFNKGGNKRGKFGEQSSESSQASETVFRILCHSRKIGSVIGKGGGIVKALREETQSKITVADSVPGSEERVIIIYSPSTKRPMKHYIGENKDDAGLEKNDMELHCAAQDALLKVHDKIVEEDIVGGIANGDNSENVVTARLLVSNITVGCLLGKKGDVIQRLRTETGASIRVLPADQLPACATSTDELVQISAKPAIVKRALYEVSTLLHLNPRKDKPPSKFPMPAGGQGLHPPGPPIANMLPPGNPMWPERGSNSRGAPPVPWLGGYGTEPPRSGPDGFDGDRAVAHGGETPTEFSMKILCSSGKIGGVIGKGGSNVRQLQQETGTSIHVDDVSVESDERVIRVSSLEALWNPRSRTIDAILLLQDKTSDHSEKGSITTRLLIPSSKVGCIIGQGGQIINEMRRRTKADIRVYSKEEKPKCAGPDEELVQVSGNYGVAKDALAEIASRFRARYLRDANPGVEPAPAGPGPGYASRGNIHDKRPPPSGATRGGRSGGYDPFQDGGRDYEPFNHSAPPRDYDPRSFPPPPRDYESRNPPPPRDYESRNPAPPRDYDPRTFAAPPRDYESRNPVPPRDYESRNPAPPRDYESHGYPAPPRDHEPRGYLAPPRDYEPHNYHAPPREHESHGYPAPQNASGYPGAVDVKITATGRGSSMGPGVGNTSEVTGRRPKVQDPYGGSLAPVAEMRGSAPDMYQGYGVQSSYHDNYGPQHPDVNYRSPNPPHHNYQNNPPQQAHYPESSYHY